MDQALEISPYFMIYTGILLVLGVGFLIHDIWFAKRPNLNVSKAHIQWLNFGLFLWILFLILYGAQVIWRSVFREKDLGEWTDILPGFLTQLLTFIFIIICFAKLPMLLDMSMRSFRSGCRKNAVWMGVYSFFEAIPLVWLTSFFWSWIITSLEKLGVMVSVDHQEIVTLFAESKSTLFVLTVALFAVVIAPFTEETIFRLGIYRVLKSKWSRMGAMIISAGLFAAVHFHITSFLALFLLGLLLARAYERTGSIITPIVFHGLFNLNTLILVWIEPNLDLFR
jgi:membrane protease YdiL (CAAX protease family)